MVERRLAAILMADAAGFSAAVSANERAALASISACLELLERVIGLHGGRVVKTMGDGLMAEFASAVNAVSAAATIQARIAERDRDVDASARFAFRIGVHAGDVTVQGGDLMGDDVNIAARLEAEAPEGGVLISSRVHEDVVGKLDYVFDDLGDRKLKGISRPVRVFVIRDDAEPVAPVVAPALPDKPSVAVLPFVNMSSDPEQEFFTDGLTEDIITGLAGVPWIFVIARNSSFVYKGAAVDVRKVGRDLGVAYVLEGSVRRAGQRLRVTGQLIDAETGKHIWAERMDGALEDVFDLQDEVTDAVIRAIAPEIRSAEMQRTRAKRPESLTAYDHLLHGLSALNRAQNEAAQGHLDRAIDAAPDYAKAIAVRAWTSTLEIAWQGKSDYDRIQEQGVNFARRALEVGADDIETAAYAGYALAFLDDDVPGGIALVRAAVEASPSFYWAHSSLGMLAGLHENDPEGTLELIENTMRLSPRDPLRFRDYIASSQCLRQLGRYNEQLRFSDEAIRLAPNVTIAHVNKVTALHYLDRPEDAVIAWRKMIAWNPDFDIDGFLSHSSKFRSSYGHNSNVGIALRTVSAAAV